MRSFSDSKIAVVLAHDAECIYRFKLLPSFKLTCSTSLSGFIVLSPTFLEWGYDFLKID